MKDGQGIWSISPRMAPLERKGLIECSGVRSCLNSSGKPRQMKVWRAIPVEKVVYRTDLFDNVGAYRRDDPQTSKDAAERINVQKVEKLVLDFLRAIYPRDLSTTEIERQLRE